MLLSILICHLTSRKEKLDRLLDCLKKQHPGLWMRNYDLPCIHTNNIPDTHGAEVETIVARDNGEMSIGAKRNFLLECASGEYCCFFDDDDMSSPDYISKILKALESKPDCVGIEGRLIRTGGPTSSFFHSIKYDHWFEKNSQFFRNPNHLNPVRRELALQVRFPEKNHGEDFDFSTRLYPLLKTEVMVEGCIYDYLK